MIYDTFDTKQADRKKYRSKNGEPTLTEYEYHYDKNGVRELVKTDRKTNVYERIQADYDSTDINKLMARFALGDESAINQTKGFYGDVTKMPDTFAGLIDRLEECKRYFDSLPVEVKQSFGNSYEQFFSTYGSDEFNKKIDAYNDKFRNHQFEDKNPPSEEPIKTDGYTEVER